MVQNFTPLITPALRPPPLPRPYPPALLSIRITPPPCYAYPPCFPPPLHVQQELERHYHPNPYHGAAHAADVVQSFITAVVANKWHLWLTPLKLLAHIVATAAHDVDHRGESSCHPRLIYQLVTLMMMSNSLGTDSGVRH